MSRNPRDLEKDLDNLARELVPQRALAPEIMHRLQQQSQRNLPFNPPISRRWIMRTSISIAAALVLTATLLFFLTAQRSAFAQVLQKIEKTQTMTCDMAMGEEGTEHLSFRGDMMRVETHEGTISIGNRNTGQWVALNPKERTAMKINMARYPLDFYALFRDFKDGKEERLGDKQLNGIKVTGYRVTRPLGIGDQPDMPLTLWVDSTTSLPVEAEVTADGDTMHITHFKWDQPLDEKLFSMDIPAGYKIQDMGGITADQLKAPPATQEAAKLILHPGVGIGDLKFGDDGARVAQLLGKPEKISNSISWEYPSQGLYLTVNARQGVITIMATSKKAFPVFNVNDFPGKLENGLAIGSSRDDVEKAYGKPERTDSNGANTVTLYYDKAYLWFMVQDGKVIQIYLNLSPAARDAIRAKVATQPASQP